MARLSVGFLNKLGFQIEAKGSEIDLVCGMEVDNKTKLKASYKDRVYYFCSENCQNHFKSDPGKYVG